MKLTISPVRATLRALVLIALSGLVSACSMAGLPAFRPAAASAPKVVATAAPVPQTRTRAVMEADGLVLPLAFTEPLPSTGGSANVNSLIQKYASVYGVPSSLIHRLVKRESGYNPRAKNGPYYGLMQIRYDTAQAMGYGGTPSGLLDADTNLRYAVKYLRGAYIVGGYNSDRAVRNYARGYYYDAKRAGLLEEAGLR
jgi:soluble lytic murein transglycosylase-like protein